MSAAGSTKLFGFINCPNSNSASQQRQNQGEDASPPSQELQLSYDKDLWDRILGFSLRPATIM